MALSDAAVVGAPIVAESNFGDGFRDDFDTLDIETSSVAGNRTGAWKMGFMDANMATSGFTYGSDEYVANGDNFVHAGINFENECYEDTRKPLVNYTPFSVSNNVLKVTSRKASGSTEIEYARVKDYELNADGSLGAFLRNKQVPYLSGMISKNGRFASSFARYRAKVKTPYGADGSSSDVRLRKAIFPAAFWLLQDSPYGCDINGDPMGDGSTTYRAGRPNGGGIRFEIDIDENFGESETAIHQTVHTHPAGTAQGASESYPLKVETGKNLRSEWRETGVDVFPEKFAFFVDGVYTHIVPTPDEIRYGLPVYVPVVGAEYDTTMVNSTTAQTNGRQQHADGSTRYMCFYIISNLARDGKYPRDLARQYVQEGKTLPVHQDTVSMEIDYIEARPLLTDNPDNFPLRINGVPTAANGTTGGDDPEPYTPLVNIPYRSNFTIERPDHTVAGSVFKARAVLPYNVDIASQTYSWSVSAEFQIISESSTGNEIEVQTIVAPESGATATGTITLTMDDV